MFNLETVKDPFARTVLSLPQVELMGGALDGLNVIITGSKRHGKDTVSEVIARMTLCAFESSSHVACEAHIYDKIKDKYGYTTLEECYQDRDNHRKEWFDLIVEFNGDDLARLGKRIFSQSNIYCGLRNVDELLEMRRQGVVDYVIWVDAGERLEAEDANSLTITRADCDAVIDNNKFGNAPHLYKEITSTLHTLVNLKRAD